MARRHAFGVPFPPWTSTNADAVTKTISAKLPDSCWDGLVEMANTFHDINKAILQEIHYDQDRYATLDDDLKQNRKRGGSIRYQSRFGEDVAHVQAFKAMWREDKPIDWPTSTEVFPTITNTTYNNIWTLAAVTLHEYQGDEAARNTTQWSVAKQRALGILNLRSIVFDIFESVEQDLVACNLKPVCQKIRSRLHALDGFEIVYNRSLKDGEREWRSHRGRWRAHVSTAMSDQAQQNRNATLIAVVFAITLISFIPLIFAWHRASNTVGSTKDVDFWLLLQSSTMQLLGLFTAIFPMYRRSTAHAWRWAEAFTLLGGCCAVVSIPLYLYTPTMWSALASFFSAAAQAGMALLLALMADSVIPVKQD